MDRDTALLAVVAEQSFEGVTIQRMPVSGRSPLVLGVFLKHNKQMIGIERVLQEKVIK